MIEPYFPYKSGSEQIPGGASKTVQDNLERFLSMLEFYFREKLEDYINAIEK
jgi:hypothetical protein